MLLLRRIPTVPVGSFQPGWWVEMLIRPPSSPPTLKIESCHDGNFVLIGGIAACVMAPSHSTSDDEVGFTAVRSFSVSITGFKRRVNDAWIYLPLFLLMEKWPWCVLFHFVHLNKRICIVNLLLMLPFCTATSPVRVDGNVCTRLGFITTKESCFFSWITLIPA